MLGTLRDSFASSVAKWPERTAIIHGERTLSFAALDASANQLANYLVDLGVGKGDGVGLLLNNCAEFAISFVACQKLGAIASCLNFRLAAASIGHAVEQESLKVLIFNAQFSGAVGEIMGHEQTCRFLSVGGAGPKGALAFEDCAGFAPTAPPPVEILEGDLCTVFHTSGTTGRPKGAALTNQGQIVTAIQYCLEMGLDRGHVGMSLAPVVIGAATNFFVAYLFIGAAQVMSGEYQAEKTLRLIEQHAVSEIFAVPTQMYQMAEASAGMEGLDMSSLRLIRSGGSALVRELLQRVRRNLGCEVLNTYGTTESCTAITGCHTGLDPEDKWESIGMPSYFQEVRVVEVGEAADIAPDDLISVPGEGQLINRGAQGITQYYCTPDAVLAARGGWHFSRDVVKIDADGYIYPVDRIDNLIISGGENIYPQEIELFLSRHPLIEDVAVCGVADAQWGQVVKALILRASDELTAGEVEKYCLQSTELARHKRPRIVEFVDSLPRNILGKIDRGKLS